MRVREFIHLAMLLLAGLLLNHCAFDNDVFDIKDTSAQNLSKSVDLKASELEDRLNKASQELEQKLERIEKKVDEANSRIGGADEGAGIVQSSQSLSEGGKVSISVTYRLPSAEAGAARLRFMEMPHDLLLILGAGEAGKLEFRVWGGSGTESPGFATGDGGQVRITFAEGSLPDKAEASLPKEIAAIAFGDGEGMELKLELSGAALHLDCAVEKITIKRSGEWVTLTSPDWTIRIKGLQPDLKVVGANGAGLGELKAVGTTEITYVAPKDGEGGAQ